MINIIKSYLKNNNYNGQGLTDYLNSISKQKVHWCASSANGSSGIIKAGPKKYYFYCVRPWAHCPKGEIIVEEVTR